MSKAVVVHSGRARIARGEQVQELQNTLLISYEGNPAGLEHALNSGSAEFDAAPGDDTVAERLVPQKEEAP